MILSTALRIFLLSLATFTSHFAHADSAPVTLASEKPIESHFQYWEDASAEAELADVRALPDAAWQTNPSGKATFGITDSAYWLRVEVQNQTGRDQLLIAELGYSQLDDVVFHELSGGTLLREFATGDTRSFYPRDVDHPNMLYRFHVAPDASKTLYIRVATQGTMVVPLQIWQQNDFYEAAANEQKLHFFYYGSLAVIILINLAVFLTLREKLYLFYALAISGYFLFFAAVRGYTLQHIYPGAPFLHTHVLLLSMPFLAMFSILFCMEFLQVRSNSPRLYRALQAMLLFEMLFFLSAPLLDYDTGIRVAAVSAFAFFSLLLVAGPVAWAAGVRAGVFFTIAWTPLTIGVSATAGRALGLLPENFFTEYAMQIGSGLEAFILTLALADRLYREREQKIQAQADILKQQKARNEAQTQLNEALTHDPVTGLPNRNRFEWMVDEQLRQNPNGRFMVGVTRITQLKEINRTLGLDRSERLLKAMAEQMTRLASGLPMVHHIVDARGNDERVYQLSGDSFGLLVNVSKTADDFQSLDNALKQLAEPVLLDNIAIEPNPRFGAASYPEHGKKAALLIRNAHVGMEMAPHGPYQTGLYSRKDDIYDESRLTLMSDLREALHHNQTELYYQPKISLATGKVVGVEALIRWHHPDRGWVPPIEFVPMAEKTGVIKHLTRWVVDQALNDLKELHTLDPALTVSVNISARDLSSPELVGLFETRTKRNQLNPEQVIIELTETAAMDDPHRGLNALNDLTAIGLKLSIDDFGAGYSSLSYLKKLPASEIKLDRALLQDIESSEGARMIVETAIRMGQGLGYQVVAEGVETEKSARLLNQLGAEMLQGYWICSPKPLHELQAWLEVERKAPSLQGLQQV
ncbi:EAL domain-containing protein (putative c-di-GMP-specific phosphodiesterase class I) [Marinobacter sp. 3-2]|uniref:EAL domain-containing protein n=1 Tax=Marinobacter sp. 3-2 TaxID=2485141 RepID=UPI000D3D6426|nr:EAL domain-containing protein [Marinobacter sp. 3-2]ROQ44698.1 EAL domain-containing protein (putative c-di-GMP-specific phosphodiesterase class I) [Marinobacter sp. 3-2]